MSEKKGAVKLTLDEQIKKTQARLDELKTKKSKTERQERNGQLMALGIIIENQYENAPADVKDWLKKATDAQVEERTKKRGLAALKRLSGGF